MNMEDEILGRLALKQGLVKSDQLKACRAQGDQGPLGGKLLARDFITRIQLERLQEEARALAPFTRTPPKPPGKKIGEILVEMRVVVQSQIDEALADLGRATQTGRKIRIGEVLQEKGYVTATQLIKALEKQGKTVMSCTGCGTSLNVTGYKPGEPRMCRLCGAPLKVNGGSLRVDDSEIRIQTAPSKLIPPHIQDITKRPMVQFGKYIIVKEILTGSFGSIFHGWQKDEKKSVGIVFLESANTRDNSAMFIQIQRELLAKGYANPKLLEVGKYGNRNYMSVSLEE